jgi:hypothetical protein
MRTKKALILLALGASTFGFFGTSFGINGCNNYALNADYQRMFQDAGAAAIQIVSDTYFADGSDWEPVVRTPATAFAIAVWDNWVDSRVPDDAELQ